MLIFNPPVIAHRGASGYAPENTMTSFIKALQLGIKWVEFDVMLTADDEPIIFHDELLERTTTGKGSIENFSYDYLRSLDAGSWFDILYAGEKIPHLRDILILLKNTDLSINIEIKALAKNERKCVEEILKLMKYSSIAHSRLLFSSFSYDALYFLKQKAPQALIGLLLHEWQDGWIEQCKTLQVASVHVNHEIMDQASVTMIKGMDKKLLCYTVNDSHRALELYSWGVDAVFSDYPDKIACAFNGIID